MGSDSDLKVMSKAAVMLEELGIEYEMTIISAHREPDELIEWTRGAEDRGIKVMIAGAGMAAALPGMCAALFALPVIGVPLSGKNLDGMDAVFSIMQMPPGVPVATVAIDGAKNAAILAAKILAASDEELLKKLKAYTEEQKEAVKAMTLKLLNDKYGIEEDDFLSAELEIVPAGKARELGMDASMILAYGQDDRVCAYTSLVAMLEVEAPEKTSCCLLVDKEEIGSVGATGMQSHFFENTMAELLALAGEGTELALRRCLASSRMLSSDVSAAFDPLYAAAFEKKNAAFFGKGIVINKFTGSGGKGGSNDANAEYVGALRAIFDDAKVNWQTAELGKVDVGGGGTIAYIMSLYGMEVIDSGVPVLSMHAPWEVTSKADIYEAKKAYVAFLKNA